MSDTPAVRRFRQSMEIDYRKWHDGVGYDISVIQTAAPADRAQIEAILVARGVRDWRDVEALAALGSPRAQSMLKSALRSDDHSIAIAVLDYSGNLIPESERTAALVAALENGQIGKGLAEALRAAEKFHPPEVVDALLRGILKRKEALLFAGTVMYIHGLAKSSYDNDLRPAYIRFAGPEKQQAFRELCGRIGVDPDRYLNR